MKLPIRAFQNHRESLLYLAAVILMVLALVKPDVKIKHQVRNYLLIADVTQSMNVQDVRLNNQAVSRLVFSQNLMKKVLESSSCGTYISLGIFASDSIGLLMNPLEVCSNYDVITEAIDHLEWRMAWKGNSRLSYGVRAADNTLSSLNVPAKLLLFSDGDDAPKVNATIQEDLTHIQHGKDMVFIGVGGSKKAPIPRYNAANEMIGYWPITENNSSRSGTSTFATALAVPAQDDQNPAVAAAEYDRYLSKLDDAYLKALATKVNGRYIQGTDDHAFYDFIQAQSVDSNPDATYLIRWLYLTFALIFIIATYVSTSISRVFFQTIKAFWLSRFSHQPKVNYQK